MKIKNVYRNEIEGLICVLERNGHENISITKQADNEYFGSSLYTL